MEHRDYCKVFSACDTAYNSFLPFRTLFRFIVVIYDGKKRENETAAVAVKGTVQL